MNLMRKFSLLAIAALVLVLASSVLLASPILKSGQTLVFYGDSITEQRIYTRYVMDYFTMRYPGVTYHFRNAGWSGDTAPGGANRLRRDVLSLKPDVVTIVFGMNDGKYTKFSQENFDAYMNGMKKIVQQLKQAKVKVVLLTPGCVDVDKQEGLRLFYNETLAKFGEGVQQLAKDENLPFFNLHDLMLNAQTQAKADDPAFTMIPDSVHPVNPGHAIMALGVLKALGCTDQPASLVINTNAKTTVAKKSSVTNLAVASDKLSFTRTDSALPAWFNPDVDAIRKYVPLTAELNNYPLTVKGLAQGDWQLTVGGMTLGTFTSDELAKGVNLAEMQGPWKPMGEMVDAISGKQESCYLGYWRHSVNELTPPAFSAESMFSVMQHIGSAMDAFDAVRIGATSQRTWQWELVKL
ncbi:MAG: SGNH/GDSL hydrolase family protein [Armatimonadota bacterium]